jgi:autophagy-related protein 2
LLRLPSNISFSDARILLLRLTVPANIYQNGISVEVEGVRIKISIHPENEDSKDRKKKPSGKEKAVGVKPSQNQSSPEPDSSEDEKEARIGLPSAGDLAQSFLETEPAREKADLRSAIAKSQALDQSMISEDGTEDDEGIGAELSLPAFIADFIRGVTERFEAFIRDIQLEATIKLQPSGSNPDFEEVTLCFNIANVEVHPVSEDNDPTKSKTRPQIAQELSSDGFRARQITTSGIHASLLSTSALSSFMSQLSRPPSPTLSRGASKLSENLSSSKSNSSEPDMMRSSMFDPHPEINTRLRGGFDIDPDEVLNSKISSSSESSDHAENGQNLADSYNSLIDQVEEPAFHFGQDSEVLSSSDIYRFRPQRSSIAEHASSIRRGSSRLSDNSRSFLSGNHENPRSPESASSPESDNQTSVFHDASGSLENPGSTERSANREDLSESKFFTHQEAESMYLSAMSQGNRRNTIPGEWSDTESDQPSDGTANVFHDAQSADDSIIASIRNDQHEPSSSPTVPHYSQTAVSDSPNDSPPRSLYVSNYNEDSPERPVISPKQQSPILSSSRAQTDTHSSLSSSDQLPNQEPTSIAVKTFFAVDRIDIYIPQPLQEMPQDLISQTDSAKKPTTIPGAFSIHQSVKESAMKSTTINPSISHPRNPESPKTIVHIANVIFLTDVAFIRLVILISQNLSLPTQPTKEKPKTTRASDQDWALHLESFSLKFVDVLKTQKRYSPAESKGLIDYVSPVTSDVLLRLQLQSFALSMHQRFERSSTDIRIRKVTLGFSDEHIISFDSSLKMRESVRDILAPEGQDLGCKIIQSPKSPTEVEIMTAPIHVRANIARLEDAIGWLGGLSTMLDLGNSMMSTVTVTETRPKSPQLKPRGVRFETGEPIRTQKVTTEQKIKTNIRIGGLAVDVLGRSVSLSLDGSAVKIVARKDALRMQIDRLRFYGPLLTDSSNPPAINLEIDTLKVDYLNLPKESDLTRLLALLSPSQARDEPDDDILLDTLLRQRRKGGLLRVNVSRLTGKVSRFQELQNFNILAEELTQLSSVTKYLPEDDRPGLLVLSLIEDLKIDADIDSRIGVVSVQTRNVELGLVTFPFLLLVGVESINANHQNIELVGEATPNVRAALSRQPSKDNQPMIMVKFVGEEMEPTLKIKLNNLRAEYHVTTIMTVLGITETASGEVIVAEIINSVASLPPISPRASSPPDTKPGKSMKLDLAIRDTVIGLNPKGNPAKGLAVLSKCRLSMALPQDERSNIEGTFDIAKASLMIIDNTKNILNVEDIEDPNIMSGLGAKLSQLQCLTAVGFVSVGEISSAKIACKTSKGVDSETLLDVEVRDDLFVLETCADSTQTLAAIMGGLAPPTPPSKGPKYRTEIVPIENMLASFTGDAFPADVRQEDDTDYSMSLEDDSGTVALDDEDEDPPDFDFDGSYYAREAREMTQSMASSGLGSVLFGISANQSGPSKPSESEKPVIESFREQFEAAESLHFDDDHFGKSATIGGRAHRWNSEKNTYDAMNDRKVKGSPLRVRLRDTHLIWNLFDGYDWQRTRDTITQAVEDIEAKAAEKLAARREKLRALDDEDDEESVIGDFLFNSIYIGISAKDDPKELSRKINGELNDTASETGSYTTLTTISSSPSRQGKPRSRRKLKLSRSRHHKMTFELKGVSGDIIVFPPDTGETQSSIDIRVQDLEIFDHVPTSTWKKFATYMHDAGERETGSSMVHIEMLTVKPDQDLLASEIVLKARFLPLRLHVDQDALDFLTRFFEFRDSTQTPSQSPNDVPFLQRAEVGPIMVKLDFKPKRVDYAGLRSGHTTEFMNFFILDGADMVLRRIILYGVRGFDKLGQSLNDIWMPDVRRNQLPGVLAGLAPVRSLVNVGAGVRDLVVVPMREYKKDGRVVRAVQKGAVAFAKKTTTELAKLGAKLAVGTQNILQNAEDLLSPSDRDALIRPRHDDGLSESPPDEKPQYSPYADQPIGVVQGLRGAYRHLERDLLLAKDAIVAMPGEVLESKSAKGAAVAVLRNAPTIVLRPAMGVSKAVGQTLMGATNSLDKTERRRIEDVSFPSSTTYMSI